MTSEWQPLPTWTPVSRAITQPVANNCGTGAGGFKRGNTCAKGRGGSKLPGPKEDRQALAKAVDDNPLDTLARRALADHFEEQGRTSDSNYHRELADKIDALMPKLRQGALAAAAYMETPSDHPQKMARWRAYYDQHIDSIRELAKIPYEVRNTIEKETGRIYTEEVTRLRKEHLQGLPGPKEDREGLQQHIINNPIDTDAHRILADTYEDEGNLEQAEKHRKFADWVDQHKDVLQERVDSLAEFWADQSGDAAIRERWSKGLADWEDAREGGGGHLASALDISLGDYLAGQAGEKLDKKREGKLPMTKEDTERVLKESIASDPADLVSRHALADFYEEEEEPTKAEQVRKVTKAIEEVVRTRTAMEQANAAENAAAEAAAGAPNAQVAHAQGLWQKAEEARQASSKAFEEWETAHSDLQGLVGPRSAHDIIRAFRVQRAKDRMAQRATKLTNNLTKNSHRSLTHA